MYTRRRYVYFHRITPVAVRELRTRSVEQREVRDLILQCMNQGSTVKLYRCHASNNRCFDGGGRRKEEGRRQEGGGMRQEAGGSIKEKG